MRESGMMLYSIAQDALNRNLNGMQVKQELEAYGENANLVKPHWSAQQCSDALFSEGDRLRSCARYEAKFRTIAAVDQNGPYTYEEVLTENGWEYAGRNLFGK